MAFVRSFSKADVAGYVAQDPRVHTVKESGRKLASFTIGVNEIFRGGAKYASWIEVTVWGKLAELAEKYLKKGSRVLVSGALKTRIWEDNEGNKRKNTYINATELIFLDSKKDAQERKEHEELWEAPEESDDEEVSFK